MSRQDSRTLRARNKAASAGTPLNYPLSPRRDDARMRVLAATIVALLILNFADEHFNDSRYSRSAKAVISHIARSFG